jgi:hypothetical protein
LVSVVILTDNVVVTCISLYTCYHVDD